ncbi:MAG: cobalamin biosynthesis protein [Deltaproteobacteria bacterium]|nr:cobalamin biosynthesis protein [Deltaproteobacteria bacterium]
MRFAEVLFPFADCTAYWWIPLAALLLEAVIGDPPGWPHPVRAIGWLCDGAESLGRRLIPSERIAGVFGVCAVLCGTWVSVRLLLLFPFFIAAVIAVYLCFAGLALGQLLREGTAAIILLEREDVESARAAIGMLVSRDVSRADRDALCRTLAETLAENVNDAFIAPFFWLVLGGPAGLWLYKAASTMDSMWGYPYEPWTRFGTAAARLDDALAFIPARLTAALLYCSAFLGRRGNAPFAFRPWFARVATDARTMKSPNAGWPMAACAWIHRAAMGGPAVYAGSVVQKPVLGPPGTVWTPAALRELCENIRRTGILGALSLGGAGFVFHDLIHGLS